MTIVATAPIAAIAGGGGLGDIIVNQASYRLEGVLGASFCVMALSAVVFLGLAGLQFAVTPRGLRRTSVGDCPHSKGAAVIRKHNRRAARAAFAISLGVAIVIGVYAAAFTRPAHATPKAAPTITIGTKNFGEEYILGQLYKQALQAKGFTVKYKENIGSTELDDLGPAEREDQLLSRVHRRDRAGRLPPRELAEDGRGDVRTREEARGREGLHALEGDAVLRHGCRRGHERIREEVRVEVDRRPEEGRGVQVRRVPRVQDQEHVPRRVQEAVRPDERVVRSAVRHLGVRGTRRRHDPGR